MSYEPVKQLLKTEEGIVDVSQGVAVLQFECHFCGDIRVVDPNNPDEAASVKDMLKVMRADGSSFAFCNHECLKMGAGYFMKHPLNVAPQQEAPTGIVLTDAGE